jgi:hypothetical protein
MAILQSKGSLGELEKNLGFGAVAFDQLFQAVKTAISALQNFSSENTAVMEQLEAVNMIFQNATPSPSTSPEPSAAGAEDAFDANSMWQAVEPIFFIHDRIKKWLGENSDANDASSAKNNTSQMGEYTNQFVFKFLGIIIESSIKELRHALTAAKVKVDEEAAQSESAQVYEDGSTASDPSHSDLSKDHFSNVLNPPAGLVATVTTNWTTQQVVRAWDDPSLDIDDTIREVLSILHHPAFAKKKTKIQRYMFRTVQQWWQDTPEDERDSMRQSLSRESVKVRGHEDHKLTMKDVQGKKKGPAHFPGSKMDLQPARVRTSFPLKWAINEAVTDLSWLLGLMSKCVIVPGSHLVNGAYVVGGFVANTARATSTTSQSIMKGARDMATRLWPFR